MAGLAKTQIHTDKEYDQPIDGMADFRKRHAFLFKVIAYVLIFAFILYDITWAQAGVPVGYPAKTSDVKVNGKRYAEGIKIPYDAGWTHDSYINGSEEFGRRREAPR